MGGKTGNVRLPALPRESKCSRCGKAAGCPRISSKPANTNASAVLHPHTNDGLPSKAANVLQLDGDRLKRQHELLLIANRAAYDPTQNRRSALPLQKLSGPPIYRSAHLYFNGQNMDQSEDLDNQTKLRSNILARLLLTGMRRQTLTADQFYEPFKDRYQAGEFFQLFGDVILWLEAEGYLRCTFPSGVPCASYPNSAPAEKAERLFNTPGPDGQTGRDIARRSSDAEREIASQLGQFLGSLFGSFIRS